MNNIVRFVRPRPPVVFYNAAQAESGFFQWVMMVDRILDNYTTTTENELRWVLLLSAIVRYADDLTCHRERAIAHIRHWRNHTVHLLEETAHESGRLRDVALDGVAIALDAFGSPGDRAGGAPF